MKSLLEGKSVNVINQLPQRYENGELVTPVELWITGSVVSLDTQTGKQVLQWEREAKKCGYKVNDYVRFMLMEECIL